MEWNENCDVSGTNVQQPFIESGKMARFIEFKWNGHLNGFEEGADTMYFLFEQAEFLGNSGLCGKWSIPGTVRPSNFGIPSSLNCPFSPQLQPSVIFRFRYKSDNKPNGKSESAKSDLPGDFSMLVLGCFY